MKKSKELLEKEIKGFKDKLESMKTYTWEELNYYEKEGVDGEVCRCKMIIANSMTLTCPICGKVLPQYAKRFRSEK